MPPLRTMPDIVMVDDGDAVYLGRLPDGPLLVLPGSAAVVVQEALARMPGSPAERVARRVGLPQEAVAGDVHLLVTQLVADEWLVPAPSHPTAREG